MLSRLNDGRILTRKGFLIREDPRHVAAVNFCSTGPSRQAGPELSAVVDSELNRRVNVVRTARDEGGLSSGTQPHETSKGLARLCFWNDALSRALVQTARPGIFASGGIGSKNLNPYAKH